MLGSALELIDGMGEIIGNFNNLSIASGGEGGIRTLEGLTPLTVFETAPFNHSGTSPTPHGQGLMAACQRWAEPKKFRGTMQALLCRRA